MTSEGGCSTPIGSRYEAWPTRLRSNNGFASDLKGVGVFAPEGKSSFLFPSDDQIASKISILVAVAIVKHPHSWDLVSDEASLDWQTLVQSIANGGIARAVPYVDYIARCIAALLPSCTPTRSVIVRRIVNGARIKQRAPSRGANYGYDPGDIGPLPLGHTADGRYTLLDRNGNREVAATANQILSPQFLQTMAPLGFWSVQFTWGGRLNATWAGETLMRECLKTGRRPVVGFRS